MEFALDIETVPNMDLVDSLPEPEVATGNLKDPEKIAAKIAEAKRSQIDKMALSPFSGRICSYAVYGPDIQKFHVVDEVSEASEIELINEIFDLLNHTNTETSHVITWNGLVFDIPFVFKRALLLKTEPKCQGMSFFTKKYSHFPHCDMMLELNGWNMSERLKLDTAASSILGSHKIGVDCKLFLQMIKDGKGEEIGVYNLKDSELTYKIFEAAAPYIW